MLSKDIKFNFEKVNKLLYKKNGFIACTKPASILFPVRYEQAGLADLSTDIAFLGVCLILVGTEYLKLYIPVPLTSDPSVIKVITIDDIEYYQLVFDTDEPMFKTSLLKNGEYVYKLTKEFISNGNVPFFIGYKDLSKVFNNLHKYTGSDVFNMSIKSELLIAAISRSAKDPMTYYRLDRKDKFKFIGIKNPHYGRSNNIARLSGAYLNAGITTALSSTPTEQTQLEKQLLR